MRILIGLLLVDRQIRWLFRREGGRFRFFPAGTLLPSLLVDRRQRRRIEQRLPPVYVRMIGAAVAGNLLTAGAIVLWDRFVGYVDALAALGVFAAVLAGLGAVLHGWLYLSVRQAVRDPSS